MGGIRDARVCSICFASTHAHSYLYTYNELALCLSWRQKDMMGFCFTGEGCFLRFLGLRIRVSVTV